ncbi:MAG: phenylalanine--tRNA ligase subunit alpha [Dethiobacter sp.]|jgi:phenylalanyl-tRNA synthetase alpha chain|nr:phenylalanine--tRNA ligase subunit alpha [Dethiobacter sp.]
MLTRLDGLEQEAREAASSAGDLREIQNLRLRYLGKKGELTLMLRALAQIPAAERPMVGKRANALRDTLEQLFQDREAHIKKSTAGSRWERERIDVTLPGYPFALGQRHPLTIVLDEIKEIFIGLGFQVATGPEIESDYYNFEALNIPEDHPARDMQDSFYFTRRFLLRTHTSPVQVRAMEMQAPRLPLRIIAPGKVYRRDDDATHSPMFHQVEGLAVDRGITFADLKGTLLLFAREMFGPRQRIRLRPSYFPFTEPSAEVDISCIICAGEGCRVCSQSGWLEILGAGLVHPRVLEVSGYDPREATGFAFGMGVERIAMLKYRVDDLRLFFSGDLRFLKQFR